MNNTVSVVDVGNNIDIDVEKAINLAGGFSPFEGSTIAIKPNLCTARKSSESGVTTDIRVIEGLIKFFNEFCKRAQNNYSGSG